MQAVILCADRGEKIWPYGSVRPKTLIPIAARPILYYLIDGLKKCGIQKIIIAYSGFENEFRAAVKDYPEVTLHFIESTSGTVDTLIQIFRCSGLNNIFVVNGDTIIDPEDMKVFTQAIQKTPRNSVLLSPLHEKDPRDWIVCDTADEKVRKIYEHPRKTGTHLFAGYYLIKDTILPYLESTPNHFPEVEVGMMPPKEVFLESALSEAVDSGEPVFAVETSRPFSISINPGTSLNAMSIW